MQQKQLPRIVIIGAGFGGIFATHTLAKQAVEVLLIDRNNFHTFSPLLYQVATCALDPSSIAYPVRSIFRDRDNIHAMLGEVVDIDTSAKLIRVKTNGQVRPERYDYLIVAGGSVTNYFDSASLQTHAFALKDLNDAVNLRHHVLKLFEKAAWADNPDYQNALMTLVVVGGGPTGLETAGALYELYNHVLKRDYDDRHDMKAKVILLEASDHLLAPYPLALQKAAAEQLASLGVQVMTGAVVEEAAADHIRLKDGTIIPTHTIVWAAGVKASPLAEMLNVPLAHANRIPIEPTMQVIGRERVYAIGDIAHLTDSQGKPYPMLIPVAQQQGILAAENILRHIQGKTPKTFAYVDRGIMATIGRSRAVAWLWYRFQLRGFLAWMAWLFFHLIVLMGFRNRVSVFISWVWNYVAFSRPGAYGHRIILNAPDAHALQEAPHNEEVTLNDQ